MNLIPTTVAGLILAVSASSVVCGQQRPDPDSPRYQKVLAIRGFLENRDQSVEEFAAEHLSGKSLDQDKRSQTVKQLVAIRKTLADATLSGLRPTAENAVDMVFETADGEEAQLSFEFDPDPPHGIFRLDFDGEFTDEPGDSPALDWDNVRARLEKEAADGWSGAVLLVRDGKIAVEQAFGWANKTEKIKNSADTVFAIGSTPIDFTKAAILQLAEKNKLELSANVTKFFDNVPDDKQVITIEHLMTGRSGLRDFHDVPGDANPDHTWIDRDEAMRRIWNQKLLFEPGKGRRHSHSAIGVLAAIVEIVSGQTYQEYTREHLFKPAGMEHTGFFGKPIPAEKLAVGIGQRSSGETNAPPFWGKTSWLVMGSGGQVSTIGDMYRWITALHDGKIVSEGNVPLITGPLAGLANGGDMFGFEIYYTQNPESMMILTSNNVNSSSRRNRMTGFARELHALVTPQRRYSLGIAMNVDSESGVTLQTVVPGSAAAKAGLQENDRLLSAGGKDLGDEPLAILDHYLETGEVINFKIERNGKEMEIEVKPEINN